MSTDNYDNVLPFADCELTTDVILDHPIFQKAKYSHKKTRTKNKPTPKQSNTTDSNSRNRSSFIYFENTLKENNFLSFVSYTGPSNTMHLHRRLYLPQLISSNTNDSTVSTERFIRDYDQTITLLRSPSVEELSLSIYIRFGILYIIRAGSIIDQTIALQDFVSLRNRGKEIKTAFYTCKGVTSPKHLLTTLTNLNYHQISSNNYSYEIQLYATKGNEYSVLHFQYDEQLHCSLVYFRPDLPANFDFIRKKTSSLFRSIDDSYSDIFDFRIQLSGQKFLSKTDPNVIQMLRGVPIDQVLYIDTSTQILHVSAKLQKHVKYLKCTRSNDYQHVDEQIRISMGTYEEFQLNANGQCEPLMKASNTMTIEFVDLKNIPSGRKLYDVGLWFSTLCQTCVDLPSMSRQSSKWFSDVLRRGANQSIKQINVNQLTTYKTQQSKQMYTNEELTFVKKILQEENLANILFNPNEGKVYQRKEIEQRYENIIRRLKTCAAPSTNEALKKVERAYQTVLRESFQS